MLLDIHVFRGLSFELAATKESVPSVLRLADNNTSETWNLYLTQSETLLHVESHQTRKLARKLAKLTVLTQWKKGGRPQFRAVHHTFTPELNGVF
jgi:hypothetical protein